MTALLAGGRPRKAAILPPKAGLGGRISDLFWRRPRLLLALLLLPPLLWLGIVYLGSLLALLLQSFFSIDEFSGLIDREFTLKTYGELLQAAESRHHRAHRGRWPALVTLASAVDRLPDRLLSPPAMPAAAGRRCSISASCCRCGRAIWSRSMPGS